VISFDDVYLAIFGKSAFSLGKRLPQSLDFLSAGQKEVNIDMQLSWMHWQRAYTAEARLMGLLADKEVNKDRVPDDSELEGSGDDFDGWYVHLHAHSILITL
jgi:hypothetical protein